MIAVSAGYLRQQEAHEFVPVRKVLLYRRNANGEGHEAAAIDITGEVLGLGRLSDKLDTDELNVYKVANIDMTAANADRAWDPDGDRFAGWLLNESKVVIEFGLVVDGAPETFPRFTGFIDDFNETGEAPTVGLSLVSAQALAENADADKAGVLVPDTLLGVGDKVRSEFYTPDTGVGEVLDLRLGGESLRPGLRWSVGQLDDPVAQAKVSFESSQPDQGVEVRADYRKWKRDLKIGQAVADLLAVVPDVPVARIDPVAFDPPPQREIVHTAEGDFLPYNLLFSKIIQEDAPPQNDAALTIRPLDKTADFQNAVDKTNVNLLRVTDGASAKWTIQYEADDVPDLEHNTVEGRPVFPKDWTEFLPGGDNRTVENSILSLEHLGGADYFIFGGVAPIGSPPDRYMSIRVRFSALNGSVYWGGKNASGDGAVLEFMNLNQVRLHSQGSSPAVSVDLTTFHVFEVIINNAANQAELYVDGTLQATRTLGTPSMFTAGNTVQLQVSGNPIRMELDFLRFYGDKEPPLASLSLQSDFQPHLPGIVHFGLISTMGPFFAQFQGAPGNPRFFWSHSENAGLTFGPETEIPNGGDVGDWAAADNPEVVRIRVEFRGGTHSQVSALKSLAFPSLSSVVVDGGDGLQSWDTWQSVFDVNDGGVQVFTASAGVPSGSGFSWYSALGAGGAIESDDKQQADGFGTPTKMTFLILMNTAGPDFPVYRESIIRLTTNTILLTLANYGRNVSVQAVVAELGRLGDMELGVNGAGGYFFRNKDTSPAVVRTLDDGNVLDVLAYNPGWDRVFNSIKAEFGNFRRVADSASEGDPVPTSEKRFRTRSLTVGGGSLMFQRDVDLATVMAKRYWSRYKEPKRRLTLKVRWMPEIELGDRVHYNVTKPRRIGPASLDARVIGIALEPMGFETELEIMEI